MINCIVLGLEIKLICHLHFIFVFAQNGIFKSGEFLVVVDFSRPIYNLLFPIHL